jgi:type IV pilus assembly protein PilF
VKTITKLLLGSVIALTLVGCVTTTNGVPKPKINEEEAALSYYRLGTEYYRQGNFSAARDRLEKAISLDPQLSDAHSVLALTYQQLGNTPKALEHYKRAVRLAPDNAGVRNSYAVFLCQERKFDEAAEQFDSAVAVGRYQHPEVVLTNAGVCFAQKPDAEKSEQYFRRALSFDANYGEALLQMTSMMYHNGSSIQARAFFERLLASNKPTAEILYLGVQIEKSLGSDKTSAELAARLLREFPKSAEAGQIMDAGYDAGRN